MIEAVEEIKFVGVLKDAVQHGSVPFGRTTLIYAENGRGKSTFADIIRAFSAADAQSVLDRKHWHGGGNPLIKFKVGGASRIFANGAWTLAGPRARVFDAAFVEANVHSGSSLEPAHRENLHHFVLGEDAVALQKDYGAALETERLAKTELAQIDAQLLAAFPGHTAQSVADMKPIPSLDSLMAAATKRHAEALTVERVVGRPDPKKLALAAPALMEFWETMSKTLSHVSGEAESKVNLHLATLVGSGSESWVQGGLGRMSGDTCPFCAQPILGNDLIAAYRHHFDAEYVSLKRAAAGAVNVADGAFADTHVSRVRSTVEANEQLSEQWKGDVELQLRKADSEGLERKWSHLRERCVEIARAKAGSPLEEMGKADRQGLEEEIAAVLASVDSYNHSVESAVQALAMYRAGVEGADAKALAAEVERLQLSKRRQDPDIVHLVGERTAKKEAVTAAIKVKVEKRKDLDDKMAGLLAGLEGDINALLFKFGARFTVKKFESTSVGATKRVEYGLDFDGVAVEFVGAKKVDPTRSFGKALSEGDRRTLALAFFLASLHKDPRIGETVVVLDDPICSLGEQRRGATMEEVERIARDCKQLILLCHDRHFIRDARDRLTPKGKNPVVPIVVSLEPHTGGGIAFHPIDIDRSCESQYRRSYRVLNDFVSSGGAGDVEKAAQSIRFVLEGYMNRKFVGRFANVSGVGGMIGELKKDVPPSPFISSANRERELDELNIFSLRYHHDGSGNWKSPVPNGTEILAYSRRALTLVSA